ncbi:MAG: HEAT repeat domain-containing protein [Pirellulaceae bacterium]|nr:HEAT repeat domain-containing protein [Pirellulaceae bacterium]
MSNPTSPPRPKWRFRIFQFSIRTMMILTAAVAVFCNWYFQPQWKDEVLAGGLLKLRRQVRVEMRDGLPPDTGNLPIGAKPPPTPKVATFISHGSWSLLDNDENLLARGEYASDVPIGWWTIWHVSGKKAAEGRMRNGAKSGVWKTWYEDGTPQSEVTYATEVTAGKPPRKSAIAVTMNVRRSKFPLEMSAFPREGTAKAWYPSGKLKFTGSYQDDRETGPWQLFDAEAKLTASGPYADGQRHGEWTLVDAAGKQTKTQFIHGRKAAELRSLLAALTMSLQSENPSDRLRAAYDLAELGEDGLPALTGALEHPGLETRIAAVRSLIRLGPAADLALPKLQELAGAKTDSPLKFQAMLAVYIIDSASREPMFDDLIVRATAHADVGETSDALGRIFECDPERQEATLRKMLAWEAENASASGQVRVILTRSEADVVSLLDNLYSPSLHLASRKTVVTLLAAVANVRHPRFSALVEKIKAETDPELKEAGVELETRARNMELQWRGVSVGQGGGIF